ncbi:MAG: YaaA family protein [Saprospiraceae bacterium]
MLILLSPSKTMKFDVPIKFLREPNFINSALLIHTKLRKISAPKLEKLMNISSKIAIATEEDIKNFYSDDCKVSPALFAYHGDVYVNLNASNFDDGDLEWADNHLCILSALYGVLKPMDPIKPYRLEMKTKLSVGHYKDLVSFWQKHIPSYLTELLSTHDNGYIINLTSQEYSKVLNFPKSFRKMIDVTFYEENKVGQLKIVSVFAKKARGSYAHWLIKNRINSLSDLSQFKEDGYTYRPELSSPQELVFTRAQTI